MSADEHLQALSEWLEGPQGRWACGEDLDLEATLTSLEQARAALERESANKEPI